MELLIIGLIVFAIGSVVESVAGAMTQSLPKATQSKKPKQQEQKAPAHCSKCLNAVANDYSRCNDCKHGKDVAWFGDANDPYTM